MPLTVKTVQDIEINPKPINSIKFIIEGKEILRFTKDHILILTPEIYEAAQGFWEAVRKVAPEGWFVKVEE